MARCLYGGFRQCNFPLAVAQQLPHHLDFVVLCFFSEPQPHGGVSPAPRTSPDPKPWASPSCGPMTHTVLLLFNLRREGLSLHFRPVHWHRPPKCESPRVGNRSTGVREAWGASTHNPQSTRPILSLERGEEIAKGEILVIFPTC